MKVVSTEVLYKGRLSAVCDTVEKDGRRFRHETVQHPGAVVVLPIDRQGNFLLVRQYRHSVRQELLEVPAGTLEVGEEPSRTALRELREEIGMSAGVLTGIGTILPAPGFCNEVQHLFIARELFSDPAAPDEDEDIEVVCLSPAEVDDAVRSGNLIDGKSLAILYKVRLMAG